MAKKSYGKLNKYLSEIIAKLMENQELCKFLYYYEPDIDIINQPDVNIKSSIINKKILKNKILSEVQKEVACTIGIRIKEVSYSSSKIDSIRVGFYVICHESLLNTNYGQRDLAVVQLIHNICNTEKFGIGKSKHFFTRDLPALNQYYVGYEVLYDFFDFNYEI